MQFLAVFSQKFEDEKEEKLRSIFYILYLRSNKHLDVFQAEKVKNREMKDKVRTEY